MPALAEFETGARVRKPSAIQFDFAFGRIGTVHRDVVDGRPCVGVLWDGGSDIFAYPEDWEFEAAMDAAHGPASG